jgi:hypothetical protein
MCAPPGTGLRSGRTLRTPATSAWLRAVAHRAYGAVGIKPDRGKPSFKEALAGPLRGAGCGGRRFGRAWLFKHWARILIANHVVNINQPNVVETLLSEAAPPGIASGGSPAVRNRTADKNCLFEKKRSLMSRNNSLFCCLVTPKHPPLVRQWREGSAKPMPPPIRVCSRCDSALFAA